MRRTTFFSMLLFVTIVLVQPGWSQIPQTVSYQGILTDADGVLIDGTVNLTFKLYEVETGGSAVWTETQNGVTVSGGIFNVILGSVGDLGIVDDSGDPIPFDVQYWLGVTIDGQTELTPRVQLTASPYSLNARSVADNAVVKSINSLKDDVILAPGANVTISSSGNRLTISAEGATGGAGDGHSLDAADGDPTDAVYVDNDGNVGIGTTSPGETLDVRGGSIRLELGRTLRSENSAGGEVDMIGLSTSGTHILIGDSRGTHNDIVFRRSSDPSMIIKAGQVREVGIGDETPDAQFEVSGSGGTADLLMISSDDATDGDRLIVKNNGKVGIGTTSPNEKLEVDGNVKVSGTGNGIIFPDGTVQSTASVFSGVDWSSTTPNFWTFETQSITYSTVADVIGSGYLMSIQQNHFNTEGYNYGYLKIVIDGIVLKNSRFSVIQRIYDGTKITGYYSSPGMLSGLFRFNRSLQVYHRTAVEDGGIQTNVSFVRD